MRVENSVSRVFFQKETDLATFLEEKKKEENDNLVAIWDNFVTSYASTEIVSGGNLLLAQSSSADASQDTSPQAVEPDADVEDTSAIADSPIVLRVDGIEAFCVITPGHKVDPEDAWLYVIPSPEERMARMQLSLALIDSGMTVDEAWKTLGKIVTARMGPYVQQIVDLADEATEVIELWDNANSDHSFEPAGDMGALNYTEVVSEQSRLRMRRMLLALLDDGQTAEDAGGALYAMILSGQTGAFTPVSAEATG